MPKLTAKQVVRDTIDKGSSIERGQLLNLFYSKLSEKRLLNILRESIFEEDLGEENA